MEQDPNIKPTYRETHNDEDTTYKDKNKLILPLVATGIAILLLVMYFALSGPSDYERGVQYLKQNQYNEALVEFQKVDTDDKDFRMAQSKINYINGYLAYKNNVYPQAKLFLTKVEPTDEYYREARLMIDKIDIASKQGNLDLLSEKIKQEQGKDTVIIKEKVIETPVEKVGEAETQNTEVETLRRYRTELENLTGKFQALYQSANSASVESKKVFVRDMDSLYSEFKNLGISPGQNVKISELRKIADSWMQKRLSYINRLIAENSVNGTSSSIA